MSKLPALAVAPVTVPKARADQLDVQAWESGLLELARVHHPSVTWWHGYRRAEERYGSYCYVCETFIVTWGGNSGPPGAARLEIDQHKRIHRRGAIVASAKNLQGKAPK